MQEIDTLLKARWIIPVEPENQALEDHALAVHQGRILAILPSAEAAARYQATTCLDLPTHALIPGLINAHTHAAMNLLRGLADDLPLMEWLNGHIWPAESRWVSEAFVRDGAEAALAEMLRGGITCFSDMYFFPEVTAQAVRDCGMRVCVGLIVVDFKSAWADSADAYLRKGLALYRKLGVDPLVSVAWAPHAPYSVNEQALSQIAAFAAELNIPIHIHLHETADEVRQMQSARGCRPLDWLERLGLVSRHLQAVHMTQLLDVEIERLAQARAHVVHCPESNMKLASGFCPLAKLQAAGVNVALGTDGAASNNDLDLFGEMRSAALLGKAVAGDPAVLPAYQVLQMATLNGARALGLEGEIGSLAPGKWADLAAVDLGEVDAEPVYHPISQLVYATSRRQVTDVWVAGRQLLKARALTTLDEQRITQRVREWRRAISQSDQHGR